MTERLISERAINLILSLEGGYVRDVGDAGGETKYGISKRAYPNEDIPSLTRDRAIEIYTRDYWVRCGCERLPLPLSVAYFDACVNMGAHGALKCLNRSLGLPDDTVAEKAFADAKSSSHAGVIGVMDSFLLQRAFAYATFGSAPRFLRGWVNRLKAVRAGALMIWS